MDFSHLLWCLLNEKDVRIDILRPFASPFGHLYLKGEKAVFLLPETKRYYQGEFTAASFFPPAFQWFGSLSVKQLISILKQEFPVTWNCLKKDRLTYCKFKKIEVSLKIRNFKNKSVILKFNKQQVVKIKIRKIYRGILKPKIFSYNLTGWESVDKWESLLP